MNLTGPLKRDLAYDSDVFKVVEEMPRFPGCENEENDCSEGKENCSTTSLLKFVYKNISYPEAARLKAIEGTAVTQFIINEDGKISHFKIVRSVSDDCDIAILEMLSKMSKTIKWIPGKQRGKPVKVLYTLPVKFKLSSEKTEETISSIPQASPTTSKAPLAPPALLLNEEVKGDTLTFVDGTLTQTDMLNIIDPSEIKEIHIYKNELPKECLV